MHRLIKILLSVVLLVLTALLVIGVILNKPRPQGVKGSEAEALADSMLQAMNYQKYRDLETIKWDYPGGHSYEWYKNEDRVEARWAEYVVRFSTKTLEGEATRSGQALTGEPLTKSIRKAWEFFANDSFWVVAPFKIRDPGTERSIVETDRGVALLVTYTSGGVTPGDSYLWILDDDFRPVAWQMWVSIIPVGGLEFSWEGWTSLDGVWFSTTHYGPASYRLKINNLKVVE